MPNINDADRNSFYDELMNDASSLMSKEASYDEKSIEEALSASDLSEEEINKLASEIEDMLNEEDTVEIDEEDDSDDSEASDDAESEIPGTEEVEDTENTAGDEEPEDEEPEDDESEEIDVEQLAAYYDEVQEKYASANEGVAQYVYDQLGCPDTEEAIHLASVVEETAEKLAYLSDISPYAVADDLLAAMAAKIEDGNDTEE